MTVTVTPLVASYFKSDGGTMFGLVPKPIWSRKLPPDDLNRIDQHAHVLLVETADGSRGIIDTGCGPEEAFSEQDIEMSALGPGWPLMEALQRRGIAPEDITFVACTHLHWDHGGGLIAGPAGQPQAAFPRAELFVHELEWEDAQSGDPLLYKSYPKQLIANIKELYGTRIRTVTDAKPDVTDGIRLVRTGGHTRGHCMAVIESPAIKLVHPDSTFLFPPKKIVFAGDVCPTHHNLRMVYQTSYDTYPLETRAWKQKVLPTLAGTETLLFFDHDPELFGCTIRADDRREFVPVKRVRTEFDLHHQESIRQRAPGASDNNPQA